MTRPRWIAEQALRLLGNKRPFALHMYIKVKLKFRGGQQRLFAIGKQGTSVGMIRATFLSHEMKIHKEEGTTLTHFPGGWLDRIGTALDKPHYRYAGPQVDCFSIKYDLTNNPVVTLLDIHIHHKSSLLTDRLAKSRIAKFYSALEQESTIASVVLVEVEQWPEFLKQHPELACVPCWRTQAEIDAALVAKGIDPHFYKNNPLW